MSRLLSPWSQTSSPLSSLTSEQVVAGCCSNLCFRLCSPCSTLYVSPLSSFCFFRRDFEPLVKLDGARGSSEGAKSQKQCYVNYIGFCAEPAGVMIHTSYPVVEGCFIGISYLTQPRSIFPINARDLSFPLHVCCRCHRGL